MKIKIFTVLAVGCLFLTVKAHTNFSNKNLNIGLLSSEKLAELSKNLEYDFDRSSVRDNYYIKLNELAKTMIDDNYAVSLKGYADSIGAYKYNWVLSDQRATNVKKYLISKGVKKNRIITTPFGSTEPIANNGTIEGRQKNRRVEIIITKIN